MVAKFFTLYIKQLLIIMTRIYNIHSAGKCSNPIELTNALALGYLDPALEGPGRNYYHIHLSYWTDTQRI